MRFTVAVLLAILMAALALPAHAGGFVVPPLIGGGYAPLDCAATVFPAPPWCHRWRSHRVVRGGLRRGRPCYCKPLGGDVVRARLAEGAIAAPLS